MTNVRVAAARALLVIARRRTTLGTAVDSARQPLSNARDRALLIELTTGVLRWRNALDALIASASRRPVREIDERVLAVLRLATYQWRYLARVPDHAVVHESVEAIRQLGVASAAGFVNAVLRALIRRGPAISLPARPGPSAHIDAQVSYLSVTLSHPAWLVRRWIDRYGFEAAEAWCRFNNSAPDLSIRSLDGLAAQDLITRLLTVGIEGQPAPYVTDAVRLPPGALGRIPPPMRDRVWVQDEGAQLVARMAQVVPGERVLDLCAAPGGKTCVMAGDLGWPSTSHISIVAADYRAARVALLRGTLRRVGLSVPVVRLDGLVDLPFRPVFDCVVVDAPCSGLGTLRRDPDLKWSRTAADLPGFADAQQRLLASAADVVRPGGRIVYATCSSEPEENTQVVAAFLASDRRFAAAPPETIRGVPSQLLDERGRLVTRPDRHALEAFYAAVLVRQEGA